LVFLQFFPRTSSLFVIKNSIFAHVGQFIAPILNIHAKLNKEAKLQKKQDFQKAFIKLWSEK